MKVDQHIEQLTDQYLRGELSGADLQAFEASIASDAAVNQHVQFQKQLVDGIADYRRIQLKARLDAIEVGAGSVGNGMLAGGALKIAGTALVASIIGLSVYTIWSNNDEESLNQLEISASDSQDLFEEKEILAIPIPLDLEEPVVSHEREEQSAVDAGLDENVTKEEYTQVPDVRGETIFEPTSSSLKSEFIPEVKVPSLSDVSNEKEFISQEVSIPEVSGNDIVDSEDKKPIDVKTYNRKSEEIRYKYFNGKLFLYGDFKKEPYEILEINSRSSRLIYLYYSEKYYQVEVSDEIKQLNAISDSKLIGELKIIRDNKLN
ncbi:MAG: hypothetical protein JXR03_16220 [Cyclobacteriaceae bacterium]